MNQMERKLKVIVAGQIIGELKMTLEGKTTIVEGKGIISEGSYLMWPKEVEEMIYRRIARDNIEIKKY